MIVTKLKPEEELKEMLKDEESLFVVSCGGCAEECGTGGEDACRKVISILKKHGKVVTGYVVVDFMCNRVLNSIALTRVKSEVERAGAILALCCGVGVQALSAVVDKYVYPGADSIFIGGFQGLWRGAERCAECGSCVLQYTAGICPIANCPKSLLNGPCGGAKNGKCEVGIYLKQDIDCVWEKIYKRLKKFGKLDKLKEVIKLRDYTKLITEPDIRNSALYDVDKR